MLSLVFLATSAISLSSKSDTSNLRIAKGSPQSDDSSQSRKIFPRLPLLGDNYGFPIMSAQAALAVDLDSKVTLYEKNPDSQLLPASTTKIVTALVSMDYYQPGQILKVGKVSVVGQKMGLVVGEEMKVEDLLSGLLVFSANDAAVTLAENYPGGQEAFVLAMNAKAKEFNLENTTFSNPAGLDGNGHSTTARDLIRISEIAMKNPDFAKIVSTREVTVRSTNGKIAHKLVNINKLIGVVEGVLGVKTGWTENARENLVTYVERDGKRVMIAVLGSQDRFGETKELIDWIFANYSWEEIKYPVKE